MYAVRTETGSSELVAVDVGSGEVTTIRDFSSDVRFSAPWSPGIRYTLAPNGASFSATVVRVRMDLWLLEGFNPRTGLLDRLRRGSEGTKGSHVTPD